MVNQQKRGIKMIVTPICELLGIKYPVFQGGMAWVSEANLASAVSEGGGLGIISAMNANADYVRQQIQKARSMTDKPFGVNIMLMSPFADEVAKIVAEEKVAVVTTGAGNPSKYMDIWIKAGIKVIPVVASVGMTKLVTRAGASAVIAEGGESGGHIGELSTMPLIPQVCDATDLPVIAAGGIGDGRGMAAAFMLGAVGIQMGTRFLVAKECTIHQNYKDKILKANDIATMTTGKRLGHPVRSLRTPFSKGYFKAEYSSMSDEDLEKLGAGALYKAAKEGDDKNGCFLAGQIAGMVNREQPAAEIVKEVTEQAEEVLKGATKWIR
jgi:enoyl-[acyl-carrier protein] reductase II